MNDLIVNIRNSIKNGNSYAALILALTLPDIAGDITFPNAKSSVRYIKWFNNYIKPKYTHTVGPKGIVEEFLTGEDCYAIRCAIMHNGSDDIAQQSKKSILDKFHFCDIRSSMHY